MMGFYYKLQLDIFSTTVYYIYAGLTMMKIMVERM